MEQLFRPEPLQQDFSQKVLKPLPFNSKTNVLQQVIRRVSKSELIDEIIIATTTHDEDEKIVEVAKKRKH